MPTTQPVPTACSDCEVKPPRLIADRQTLEVLGEVLAEGWGKAARTWMRYHGAREPEIRFGMNRLPAKLTVPQAG
jgi:hypothetical protein